LVRKSIAVVLSGLVLLGLSGCQTESFGDTSATDPVSCVDLGTSNWSRCSVPLEGDDTVLCVTSRSFYGEGISCDWEHVAVTE
jgi:hypothetical protein